jgi:hypothetical protein
MRWYRSHRLEVVALALFALACQLGLSFGHVHLDPVAGNSAYWTIAAASGKVVAAPSGRHAHTVLSSAHRPSDQNQSGQDFCAICANLSLASTLVVPATPTLLSRVSAFKELHWSFATAQTRSIDRFHFDARGPPTA